MSSHASQRGRRNRHKLQQAETTAANQMQELAVQTSGDNSHSGRLVTMAAERRDNFKVDQDG